MYEFEVCLEQPGSHIATKGGGSGSGNRSSSSSNIGSDYGVTPALQIIHAIPIR